MMQLNYRHCLCLALLTGVISAFGGHLLGMQGVGSVLAGSSRVDNYGPVIAASSDERNNIEVYRATAPGVVFITTATPESGVVDRESRSGTGSGVIIDREGHILTNEHVIAGATEVSVRLSGDRSVPARVIGADVETDLAVLKIEAPGESLTVIQMSDSNQLTVGQKVLAIGNPFGLDRTLTTGVISGLQRPIHSRSGRLIEGAIQTDASINPGNSGGPLLDSQGRMIGINSQILSPAGVFVGVGFAIPTSIIRHIVPQLMSGGRVSRPRLGVGVQSVRELREQTRLPYTSGLLVIEVVPGSPAAQAGLRGLSRNHLGDIELGDVIIAIDGTTVNHQDDLTRILDSHQVGDEIEMRILRGEDEVTVTIKLSEASPSRRGGERRRQS